MEQMKNISYTLVVGNIMYVQVCTRLSITFVVIMLGRYQREPSMDHYRVANKVLRCLKGTKEYMLMYRQTDNLEVIGYSDPDFTDCVDSVNQH